LIKQIHDITELTDSEVRAALDRGELRDYAATKGQLSRDDLKTMAPAEINRADREGRLADVKEGKSK
jgi:hypothetical protein